MSGWLVEPDRGQLRYGFRTIPPSGSLRADTLTGRLFVDPRVAWRHFILIVVALPLLWQFLLWFPWIVRSAERGVSAELARAWVAGNAVMLVFVLGLLAIITAATARRWRSVGTVLVVDPLDAPRIVACRFWASTRRVDGGPAEATTGVLIQLQDHTNEATPVPLVTVQAGLGGARHVRRVLRRLGVELVSVSGGAARFEQVFRAETAETGAG